MKQEGVYEKYKELFDSTPVIVGNFNLRSKLFELLNNNDYVEQICNVVSSVYKELCRQTKIEFTESNKEYNQSILYFPKYKIVGISDNNNNDWFVILAITDYGNYLSMMITKKL